MRRPGRRGSARVELSRAADLVASGLTEMRGATAPRLLLELICARVLLPGADDTERRPDGPPRPDREAGRHHRRPVRPTWRRRPQPRPRTAPRPPTPRARPPSPTSRPLQINPVVRPVPPTVHHDPAAERPPAPAAPAASTSPPAASTPETAEPAAAAAPASDPAPAPQAQPAAETGTQAPGGLSLVDVRRLWPDIVEATKLRRRVTWIHLTTNAQVVAVDAKTLTLGFSNAGARDSFDGGGSAEIVRQAAIDVVGADWRIETIVDPGAKADSSAPRTVTSAVQPPSDPAPAADRPAQDTPGGTPSQAPTEAPDWARDDAPPAQAPPAPEARTRHPRRPRRRRRHPPTPTPSRPHGARSSRPAPAARSRPGRTTGPSPTPTPTPTTSTPTTRVSPAPSCSSASSAPRSSKRSATSDPPTPQPEVTP